MRNYGYLDSTLKKIAAAIWAFLFLAILFKELRYYSKQGFRAYFITSDAGFWNWFEVVFIISVLMMVDATYRYWQMSRDILETLQDPGRWRNTSSTDALEFTDTMNYGKLMRTVMRNISTVTVLGMFKVFKYMSLSPNVYFTWKVLIAARQEMYGFLIVFFMLMACFAFMATAIFGFKLRYFHNFASSFLSLIRLSVGILDFDYAEWQEADDVWAPIFVFSFVFLMMLVAVNMFISILSEYYDKINTQEDTWIEDVAIFRRQGVTVPSSVR
jgi:hypothetical protein